MAHTIDPGGRPLDPDQDFKDDGGTPAFRARQRASRMAPVWAVIRFVWLFPLVGTGALFVWFMLWTGAVLLAGPAWTHDNWVWLPLFAFGIVWKQVAVKEGGFGSGALDIRGMMNSPSGGAWGAIATYFRSLFVLSYACYSIFFWLIFGVAVWMWQSGAWQHADAIRRGAAGS